MTTSLIHYNVRNNDGRAIQHLLEKSALADITDGMEIREHSGGGRTLIVHPQLASRVSDGEGSLFVILESIAGQGQVNLLWALEQIDERSRRAVAEAVFIAGGFRGATVVEVAS